MPELPEVEALARFLDARIAGRRIGRCELASFAALKTVAPPIKALLDRPVTGCGRRGKFLFVEVDDLRLVIHLSRGGWVRWYDSVPAARARPTRGPLALRLGLSADLGRPDGPGLDLTEAGTQKRLALWVVRDLTEVPAVAGLGPDALRPGLDTAALARILTAAPGTIKSALTTQSLIAGVGNAFSDEILHACRLSPFRPARSLSGPETDALRVALATVLGDAVARAVGRSPAELTDGKRRALRVHGRAGQACPACGDVVRSVSFATRSLQYCATCQTHGTPLADRRLSRLLR